MTRRARRVRETPEVAAGARRMIRAVADRACTDVDALALLRELREEVDGQLARAALGAHDYGWSWTDIGRVLGMTRQAAQQRYGAAAKSTGS